MNNRSEGSSAWKFGGLFAALAFGGVLAVWFWRGGEVEEAPAEEARAVTELLEFSTGLLGERVDIKARQRDWLNREPVQEVLSREVINNPDCGMRVGKGAAADLAVVAARLDPVVALAR